MIDQTREADIAALSFEDALRELEEVVRELETGQAPLERSIDIYQRGARLKAHCQQKLEAARLQVEQIRLGPDGAPAGLAPADYG